MTTETKEVISSEIKQDLKPTDTEKCLSDLFNNLVLSDMSLVNPSSKGSTRIHKAIVASGSKYFLEVFRTSDMEVLTSIEVPKPIKTVSNSTGSCSDENVNRILKFIYHD